MSSLIQAEKPQMVMKEVIRIFIALNQKKLWYYVKLKLKVKKGMLLFLHLVWHLLLEAVCDKTKKHFLSLIFCFEHFICDLDCSYTVTIKEIEGF